MVSVRTAHHCYSLVCAIAADNEGSLDNSLYADEHGIVRVRSYKKIIEILEQAVKAGNNLDTCEAQLRAIAYPFMHAAFPEVVPIATALAGFASPTDVDGQETSHMWATKYPEAWELAEYIFTELCA
jgi:hypothetical protein